MKTYCLFFLLGISYRGNAQVIDSKICDSTDRFPITRYVSFLKTGTLIPLDSILYLNAQNKFMKAPDKPVLVLDYDPYYYWFRIIVNNKELNVKNLMLLMAPIGMREGKLFQNRNNKWELIGATGIKYPFEKRSYLFTHFVFPFSVGANKTDTLFLSTDAHDVYKSYGFALLKPDILKVIENKLYFYFGIIVGLLLLFCMINVSLYFNLKDKIHLWYALHIVFLFLIVMKNDHLDQQFLHWDSEFAYRLTPLMAIGAIALAILMHVVQLFLVNIYKRKLLYKISFAVKINVLASGIAHFLAFYSNADMHLLSFAFSWAKYSVLLTIVIIIINCIYSIVNGFKSAFFILAGLLFFLAGAVQRLFFPSTISFLFPPSTFHQGIILETLITSIGMIYQNQRKGYAVDKTKFEIEEQTKKEISQEIHDNICQELGLAKLNINTMAGNSPELLQEKITNSAGLITDAIQALRDLSRTLNTDNIIKVGLIESIENQLKVLSKAGDYETGLELRGQAYHISDQHTLILFRIFQEVLNNIIKHSKANAVKVKIFYHADYFQLKIIDNGQGFEISTLNQIKQQGLGIWNMKNRANIIGAEFDIDSTPGIGTTITLRLPVSH